MIIHKLEQCPRDKQELQKIVNKIKERLKDKIKPLEWHGDGGIDEWYTILAFEYPDRQCGNIYDGYRIVNLGRGGYKLSFCDDHLGGRLHSNVESAFAAAFEHWKTIIKSAIDE